MDCSTPGLSVHYQLQEFTQTHIHWVSDAIQPSHPLSSPSPKWHWYQINSPSSLKVCCSWYYYSYLSYCMISLCWFMSCSVCPLNSWSCALNLIVITLRIKIFFQGTAKFGQNSDCDLHILLLTEPQKKSDLSSVCKAADFWLISIELRQEVEWN